MMTMGDDDDDSDDDDDGAKVRRKEKVEVGRHLWQERKQRHYTISVSQRRRPVYKVSCTGNASRTCR